MRAGLFLLLGLAAFAAFASVGASQDGPGVATPWCGSEEEWETTVCVDYPEDKDGCKAWYKTAKMGPCTRGNRDSLQAADRVFYCYAYGSQYGYQCFYGLYSHGPYYG